MSKHYILADGVTLSMEVDAVLQEIAESYFAATGKTLYITSGTRTPRAQAEAMYILLAAGSHLDLYANQIAAQAIRRVYLNAVDDGREPAQIIHAMSIALEEQVSQGVFLSRHMTGRAADVRNRDMTAEEQTSFERIARKSGVQIVKEDTPPHYHLQI